MYILLMNQLKWMEINKMNGNNQQMIHIAKESNWIEQHEKIETNMRIEKRVRTEGKLIFVCLPRSRDLRRLVLAKELGFLSRKQRSEMRKNPNAYIWKNGAELLLVPCLYSCGCFIINLFRPCCMGPEPIEFGPAL